MSDKGLERFIVTERAEDHIEDLNRSVEHLPKRDQTEEVRSQLSSEVAVINETIMRGDLIMARQLIEELNESELTEQDREQITRFQKRLMSDPVEFIVPIVLFCFWLFIFWRSVP